MFRRLVGVRWLLALVLVLSLAGRVSAETTGGAESLKAEVIRLYQAGKYAEAIPIAAKVLELTEAVLGPEHPEVAVSLNGVAELYKSVGRYAEAEPLYMRSLALREKAFGLDHLDVAQSRSNLASLWRQQGRFAQAEPLYLSSLILREKALGANHPDVGYSLNELASLYRAQARYAEAEKLYLKSLALFENIYGYQDIRVAGLLNNLATLYTNQGRLVEAEPLFKRALKAAESAQLPNHSNTISALNNLAYLHRQAGRVPDATDLFERALKLYETHFGVTQPGFGNLIQNLATTYLLQGRLEDATRLIARLRTLEKPTVASVDRNEVSALLAALSFAQGDLDKAEERFKELLSSRRSNLGSEHPEISQTLGLLGWLKMAKGDWPQAAEYWKQGLELVVRRASRGADIAFSDKGLGLPNRKATYVDGLLKARYRWASGSPDDFHIAARAMLETAQWAKLSEAAVALTQMSARSAGRTDKLVQLGRERQDLLASWQTNDKRLIAARGQPPEKRSAELENGIRTQISIIDARLAAIDAEFATEFPDYAELVSSQPVDYVGVQSSLRDGEAMVLLHSTDDRFEPLPEETFIWVVTKAEVRWLRSDLGTEALAREVGALRCGLDATAWHGDGALRCADLLKLPLEKAPKPGEVLPFDTARAHALYKSLLGDAEDLIRGTHLLVVPSGALTTLPFQVLVTKAPTSSDLASVSWLAREHAITVLPSVSSLAALRRTAKPSAAPKPMIGIANPLIDGDPLSAHDRERAETARKHTGCAATANQQTKALRTQSRNPAPVPQPAGLADLAHLKMQAPLPETADEVCEVARAIGADVGEMRIGAKATETEVKRLSQTGELAKFRIAHFATHGLLAGQLDGTREPGLILTPPAKATPDDDGYLSASEVAALMLDADWVILSACNTAGGAGQGEAAEALSGLARVFFYAGARALLVSHWEVDSAAAVKLVTSAIGAMTKDSAIGRAEALRRAMLSTIADTTRPVHLVPAAHPSVWAPFVVVGEGGVAR